jgi:peptidoglycan/xylan/chitin deacetylase (PgdA/CDA1 family)
MRTSPPKLTGHALTWRQALRRLLAALLPARLFLVRGRVASRCVYLTFDDGPHPEYTPHLLDRLKEAGVCATFFVVGRAAERHPDVIRRIAAEGHLVANHSFTHTDPSRVSSGELLAEVEQTQSVLRALLGTTKRLFRPPHGKVTAAKLWRLWRAGWTVVLWNLDTKDYACRSATELRAWLGRNDFAGGDVVLMHDTCPHALEILPELVGRVRERGLHFATLAGAS